MWGRNMVTVYAELSDQKHKLATLNQNKKTVT